LLFDGTASYFQQSATAAVTQQGRLFVVSSFHSTDLKMFTKQSASETPTLFDEISKNLIRPETKTTTISLDAN